MAKTNQSKIDAKNQKQREKLRKQKQKDRERRKKRQDKLNKATTRQNEAKQARAERRGERAERLNRLAGAFGVGRGVAHKRFRSSFMKVGVAVTLMAVGAGYSFGVMRENIHKALMTETLFDTTFTMSKSGVAVNLSAPVASDDGYSAYIPIQFKSMDSLPTDADDYRVYILGTDGEMTYEATGQFIMYSTSGNAVLKVSSPTKIQNEVVGIILQSTKDLALTAETEPDDNTVSKSNDESGLEKLKDKSDMIYFTINLAGSSIERDKKLDGDVDLSYLYAKFYIDTLVDDIKSDIDKNNKLLETYYARAEEYISILQREGYTVPETPTVATPDGLPSIVYPVDLTSDVATGFVNADDIATMTDIVNKQSGGVTSDTDNDDSLSNSVVSTELGTLPENLEKSDGTNSGDVINRRTAADGTRTAAEIWIALQSTWSDICKLKIDNYQRKALKLYTLQLDFQDTVSNITVGSSKNFKQLGKVKVSTKSTGKTKTTSEISVSDESTETSSAETETSDSVATETTEEAPVDTPVPTDETPQDVAPSDGATSGDDANIATSIDDDFG